MYVYEESVAQYFHLKHLAIGVHSAFHILFIYQVLFLQSRAYCKSFSSLFIIQFGRIVYVWHLSTSLGENLFT